MIELRIAIALTAAYHHRSAWPKSTQSRHHWYRWVGCDLELAVRIQAKLGCSLNDAMRAAMKPAFRGHVPSFEPRWLDE
jgi:hypothetical protein